MSAKMRAKTKTGALEINDFELVSFMGQITQQCGGDLLILWVVADILESNDHGDASRALRLSYFFGRQLMDLDHSTSAIWGQLVDRLANPQKW